MTINENVWEFGDDKDYTSITEHPVINVKHLYEVLSLVDKACKADDPNERYEEVCIRFTPIINYWLDYTIEELEALGGQESVINELKQMTLDEVEMGLLEYERFVV